MTEGVEGCSGQCWPAAGQEEVQWFTDIVKEQVMQLEGDEEEDSWVEKDDWLRRPPHQAVEKNEEIKWN